MIRIAVLLCLGVLLVPRVCGAGARHFKSGPIQITADGRWVWLVNTDNESVSRLDTESHRVTEWRLPDAPAGCRHSPRGLSVTEDGAEVWIACHDSDRIHVMDGATGNVLARIDTGWGSGPHSLAFSRDQKTVLVSLLRQAQVLLIDAVTRTVTHRIAGIPDAPMGLVWLEDGESAWITHLFAPGAEPFLTNLEVSGDEPVSKNGMSGTGESGRVRVRAIFKLTTAGPLRTSILSEYNQLAEGGLLTLRGHPAQVPSVSGWNRLTLPVQYSNIHQDIYSPDSIIQSSLRHFDLGERRLLEGYFEKIILSAVWVHDPDFGNALVGHGWNAGVSGPIDIGFSADGRITYLVHELSNDLSILPHEALAIAHFEDGFEPLPEIKVGHRPIGLAASPTTDFAYVLNRYSRDVSVVDVSRHVETHRIPATPLTGEPFSERELTGARLFHTSADPRVSANQKVGCASCHIDGEHDGRSWSFQHLPGNHGPRSVPSLLGLNRTLPVPTPSDPSTGTPFPRGQLHRSGDRDEIQDFEHTFRGPAMGGSGFLGDSVRPELGSEQNAGTDPDLDALADYLLSLEPLARSPHRAETGSLTEAAVRGATYFRGTRRSPDTTDAGCAKCHVPETGFVDFQFHDVGQFRAEEENELRLELPGISPWTVNTMSLIGLWATPPYDGGSSPSVKSIRDLLGDFAGRSPAATLHGWPDGLTRRQLEDVAEFVLSIDGNMTAAEVRSARDTDPPRMIRVEPASLSTVDVWFNETVEADSVENPGHWRLESDSGEPVAIREAVWNAFPGNRVTLRTDLKPNSAYVLGATRMITDAAGRAELGTANSLDPSRPENRREFALGETLTITLGCSGSENITVPVHDVSLSAPDDPDGHRDGIQLRAVPGSTGGSSASVNTGLLRFDWVERFVEITETSLGQHLLDAEFSLWASGGESQSIELRRVLQPWSDPRPTPGPNASETAAPPADGGDTPPTAPTWTLHAPPAGAWNRPGAEAHGTSGDWPGNYNGAHDLTAPPDVTVVADRVNERIRFTGRRVTDAFRFWLQNPSENFGYALRLLPGSARPITFHSAEERFSRSAPILKLTYALRSRTLEIRRAGSLLFLSWPARPLNLSLHSRPLNGTDWTPVNTVPRISGGKKIVRMAVPTTPTLFRLIDQTAP